MGPYLSKPQTKVFSKIDENGHFVYCTAEMQGWRKTQEDAHSALLNYDGDGSAFFAVFDGHGGNEISKYCSMYLPDFIKQSSLYKDHRFKEALEESFLQFDQTLKQPKVIAELKKLASLNNVDAQADIDPMEPFDLQKEATMPIEEVITKNFNYSLDGGDDNNDNLSPKPGSSTSKYEDEIRHNGARDVLKATLDQVETSKEGDQRQSSNNNLHRHLLRAETLKAFLKDYIEDEDEEEDEDEDETDEENGEVGNSSEDDDEEDEEEIEDDDDDDNDDDDVDDCKIDMFSMEYNEPGKGSGCTAIVAIIRDNTLYVANVGDSRCVLSRQGKAVDMSEDHKPEDATEKSRILKAGGEITADGRVNGGLNLSRAIGDHMYKNNTNVSDREQMITALPDIRTYQIDLDQDDFLFLACDGIWNSMNSQEVITFINERLKNHVHLKDICEELFKICLAPNTDGDGSGCDNMTCILVQFKKNPYGKRQREETFQEVVDKKRKENGQQILTNIDNKETSNNDNDNPVDEHSTVATNNRQCSSSTTSSAYKPEQITSNDDDSSKNNNDDLLKPE